MRLVKANYEIMNINTSAQFIELCGKVCYKSEEGITQNSASAFIRKLLKSGHESVIEHSSITVKFIVDRGVSHELVRHRLCSFSQESTRYCNYAKKGVTFVIPPWVAISPGEYTTCDFSGSYANVQWYTAMLNAESWYIHLLDADWSPQKARSVLPNSLKTEIVVTANVREWRHILKLRTSNSAHPQMQEIMRPLLNTLQYLIPILFDDITFHGEKE